MPDPTTYPADVDDLPLAEGHAQLTEKEQADGWTYGRAVVDGKWRRVRIAPTTPLSEQAPMTGAIMEKEYADERADSPMWKVPTLCDGKATGHQCEHYWAFVSRVDVLNPGQLKKGRTDRFCLVPQDKPAPMHEAGVELALWCNKYQPSDRRYCSDEDITKQIQKRADKAHKPRGLLNILNPFR